MALSDYAPGLFLGADRLYDPTPIHNQTGFGPTA